MLGGGNVQVCALKTDGTVRCWGDDNYQALGNGNADTTDRSTPVQVLNMTGVAVIEGGGNHMCAIKENNSIWCWGNDAQQQLGNGNADTTSRHTPIQVVGISGLVQYDNALESCSGIATGYSSNDSDCNDANGAINPGAAEICDSIDNDCDGEIDEGVINTYYEDVDGDGYFNGNFQNGCSAP